MDVKVMFSTDKLLSQDKKLNENYTIQYFITIFNVLLSF